MNYCAKCAFPILKLWRGWPLREPVPLLPLVRDGKCEVCESQGVVLSNTAIQWLNYHGPYNTGLPDFWLLVADQKTVWGLPYHSESVCPRCGSRAVLSEHGDSRHGRFEYKLGCTSCYEEASKRKQEEIQRQRDLEAMHRQERQDYFRALATVPFADRLPKIAADNSIDPYRDWREWNGWKTEWGRCSEEEIVALSAERTQHLIDLCESNSVLKSLGVLQRLYDKRHELRQAAIAEVRSKYGNMSPQDQLTELVVSTTTPILHFPVELANVVTDDWLDTIPDKQKANFLFQLSNCKLRVWIKVRKRLSYAASPNNANAADAKRRTAD